MDDPYIVIFLIPEHRIVTCIHLGCSHNLGVIGQELIPGLFRNIGGIFQADHPVDPVQAGDESVILVLGTNKCQQQQDHSQTQRESPDGNDREKFVVIQGPEVDDKGFHEGDVQKKLNTS